MKRILLSIEKPYRILLGLFVLALAGFFLWSALPCPVVKDPAEIRNIRIEYNGEYVTEFDQAQIAELLGRATARRYIGSSHSYRCKAEISFYYGDTYRPYHLALGEGSDFCYGMGPIRYQIIDAPAVLSRLEEILQK